MSGNSASRHRSAKRWWAVLGAAVVATVAAALVSSAPANAAPPRRDSAATPIIFVHGFNVVSAIGKGTDCGATWGPAAKAIRASGWTGPFLTFGYYNADTKCTWAHGGTGNLSIQSVGLELANDIYNHYTRYGKPVDIIAHSMGGLVVRSALDSVAKKLAGFPKALYVENVATLSTPHDGTKVAYGCLFYTQCRQMLPGSGFLSTLGRNPQSAMGTDWTLLGSTSDGVVSWQSAIDDPNRNWGHKGVFNGLSHSAMRTAAHGGFTWRFWNFYQPNAWHTQDILNGPVLAARSAVYWTRLW